MMPRPLFAALSMAFLILVSPAQATSEGSDTVDHWMEIIKEQVLDSAAASGGKFPAYNRWLGSLAYAVRTGMRPQSLKPGPNPFAPLAKEAQILLDQADAAGRELAPFTQPPPDMKDLELLAALQERTEPRRLTSVMLTAFVGRPAAVRVDGAARLVNGYKLPK